MVDTQDIICDLIETKERSKSNAKRLDDMDGRVRELEKKEEAIFEVATSVKLIAQNVANMQKNVSDMRQGFREDLSQVKAGQNETNKRIDAVKNELDNVKYRPMLELYESKSKFKKDIWNKIIIGLCSSSVVAVAAVLKMLYDYGYLR